MLRALFHLGCRSVHYLAGISPEQINDEPDNKRAYTAPYSNMTAAQSPAVFNVRAFPVTCPAHIIKFVLFRNKKNASYSLLQPSSYEPKYKFCATAHILIDISS